MSDRDNERHARETEEAWAKRQEVRTAHELAQMRGKFYEMAGVSWCDLPTESWYFVKELGGYVKYEDGSMKISIAEVKRRLVVGVEFTAEYVGAKNARRPEDIRLSRRRVISNKTSLVSRFLSGQNVGEDVHLGWKNVTADERDGSIFLTMTERNPPEEFLKITIP